MISIAMTTYNGEKFLKEQLDSLLNQSMPADEIIIIDDCSTDSTAQILRQYEKENSTVKVYINKENLGYKKNFKKAIRLCKGDLIFLCDQDDFWHKDKIQIMKETMDQHPAIKSLSSSFQFMDQNGNRYSEKLKEGFSNQNICTEPYEKGSLVQIPFEKLMRRNFFQGCATAMKRSIADEYLRTDSYLLPHDWLIHLLSAHENGHYFYNIELFDYRIHENNAIGIRHYGKFSEKYRLISPMDLYSVTKTYSLLWPDEFKKSPEDQKLLDFTQENIEALKKRDTKTILKELKNPIYSLSKSTSGKIADLLFCLFIPKNKVDS